MMETRKAQIGETEYLQFRIAIEGSLPPVPDVLFGQRQVLASAGFLDPSDAGLIAVPEELVNRELLDLDLGDPKKIGEFTSLYGQLGTPGWRELPERIQRQQQDLSRIRSIHAAIAARIRTQNPMMEWSGATLERPNERLFSHVDEFRVHAAALRDAARVWFAISRRLPLQSLQESWESDPEIVARPNNGVEAVRSLVEVVTAGLSPFRPGLVVITNSETPLGSRERVRTLYSTLCLQLAHQVARKAKYRRCPECKRWFERHRGRAEQAQYRTTGVRYCSFHCSKAHAQRAWRQRQKSESKSVPKTPTRRKR